MIVFPKRIYQGSPVPLEYTFTDENDNIIDLTGYASITLELKIQGSLYASVDAAFVSPRSGGQAVCGAYSFPLAGTWNAQFIAVDSLGNLLPGEIVSFVVVPRVRDLTINQPARW